MRVLKVCVVSTAFGLIGLLVGAPAATAATAGAASAALIADASFLTGSSFTSGPASGASSAVITTPLAGFPTDGSSFTILSSGNASAATTNNQGTQASTDLGITARSAGGSDYDATVLKVDVTVPAGTNCLQGFDFRFLSEEFPEFVGSSVNDAFIAELDSTTWTTSSGTTIVAPNNFAFDSTGDVVSINSSGAATMTAANAAGTVYDGATAILSAATPITPGAHSIYFTIFDQGDATYDSAVFLDNLRFTHVNDTATECKKGVTTAPTPVVATAPTFTDPSGSASDTYTIPATTGVTYKVNGVTTAAGTYPASGTVTVTATANSGYEIDGTSSWSHTFDSTVSVTATAPTNLDSYGTAHDSFTIPSSTGVQYLVNGVVVPAGSHAYTGGTDLVVTAQALPGYTLTGTNSWTLHFSDVPLGAPTILGPADDSVTPNKRPLISGTADPGNTVTLTLDGTTYGPLPVSAGGTWSFTPASDLIEGPHAVSAVQTSSFGENSPASGTTDFTVDSTAPAAPAVTGPANGDQTNDTTPTYTGTGEAGATVTVIVDGVNAGTALVDGAGNWTFTPTAALAPGAHTVSATQTDPAGNTGSSSATNTFVVDTTAPAAPGITAPAEGARTNDTTPTYTGTGEAGAEVSLTIDGDHFGPIPVDATGHWTFTPTVDLDEGPHTVSATQTDPAGNTSAASADRNFVVDLTAPSAPAVSAPAQGEYTNDTTPTYSGTGEANATVTVLIDGSPVGTTVADGSGNWTFTPTTPLPEGPYTVTASQTDVAGNASSTSTGNTFTVDTTAPAAPVVINQANGSTTNDATPVISGTGEPGATVSVVIDGTTLGTALVGAGGSWTFTPTTDLSQATHAVKATQTDPAGNTSGDSNTNTFTVDTTAAAAPVVSTPANGSHTNDTTPTVTGTAEPNATVTVSIDGTVVGTTTADGSGAWSFTPTTPLDEDLHQVSATQTDAGGNTSPDSAITAFTVDTTAPDAPAVLTPADDSATNDTTPTVTGTGEPGATVTVLVDGDPVGTTVVAGDGTWTFEIPDALDEGPYDISATQTDPAGNVSDEAVFHTVTIDTTAPVAPVVSAPTAGEHTSDDTPAVTGTGEPGATVTVVIDGSPAGTATVQPDGSWSFTSGTLIDGVHTVAATQTDPAGNTGPATDTTTFTVDTEAPAAPAVTGPADGTATNDTTPILSGTGEPGATVSVIVDGATLGTAVVAGDGSWTFTPTTPLGEGEHVVTATQTDEAGNTSPASSPVNLTVDITAPVAPAVTTPAAGTSTPDNTPTVTGTGEPGATVTVVIDGADAGTAQVQPDGTWSFTPATPLGEGNHQVSASQTDPAGNTGPASGQNGFTVDTEAPATPAISGPSEGQLTNDTTPDITGTGEAGATVTVTVDGVTLGTTTVAADGTWTFTPSTALADGSHATSAVQTDAAGNVSPATADRTFSIDGTAPAAPAITGPASGTLGTDNTPTITGTGEPGATVHVLVDGVEVGTATVAADGTWSFTPTTAVADGTHSITATQTDPAGNTGPASGPVQVTIDTTAPAKPVQTAVAGGSSTKDTTPTLSGTGEPGATITVTIDGDVAGTTTVGADGKWTFTPGTPLAEGSHNVSITETDVAGHQSPATTLTFTVDTTEPAKPSITGLTDNTTTTDTTPTISGTGEPGATVTVYIDGKVAGTTTVKDDGTWSLTVTDPLGAGDHTVRAVQTDAAGNVSESTSTVAIKVASASASPTTGSTTGSSGSGSSGSSSSGSLAHTGAEIGLLAALGGALLAAGSALTGGRLRRRRQS